jgi:UDP-3-O-[3-hydroxymyristoyl] glucosamine N-acyltransferase
MEYSLRIIAEKVGGQLSGDGDEVIRGINSLDFAKAGELTFAEHARLVPQVHSTNASAIIVPNEFPPIEGKNLLRVAAPRLAFIKAMVMFQPEQQPAAGIHPTAVISPEARLAEGVAVAECAVIRENARIGRKTVIDSGVHIGRDVAIGENCYIGPNVTIMHGSRLGDRVIVHAGTVIGGDGFGYNWSDGRHIKIPQIGNVVIEDDVEIGCNVCVDRATFGSTIIRRGTKIDNLVQIAHNDVIGEHVIITGQVGLSGSVTVGNRVVFGGQSGVADHITIGDDAQIGAASAVIKDVKSGQVVWGFPARPIQRVKRELASLARLPRALDQLRKLGLLRKRDPEADG